MAISESAKTDAIAARTHCRPRVAERFSALLLILRAEAVFSA
jgi:hypothetical protein